ncbi:MAG: undecaprenyldiphospho-muramoylpentapeptide beta-N-acetylglucosaminyltransferase [Chloroflexi bacterium]|nr:undecaprenyldiphospho-muramoylpentapeptide beta-N-acetylglucosaminyltransferase [Chloroflexota bacterium]
MRLLISGGGTGGHTYPALTVAAAARIRADGERAPVELLYVGRAGGIEERLARRAQIDFESIQVGGVRGLAPATAARNLWDAVRSVGRVRAAIRSFEPSAIFVTGGYVSAPVVWAGALEHIPSIIYLPDLEPGWAVRATGRWATRIAVSFPEAAGRLPHDKTVVTGYPVRAEFFGADKLAARRHLGLDPNVRTVTVFGGSAGAHHINQAVAKNFVELVGLAQVVLVSGRPDEDWMSAQARRLDQGLAPRAKVFGYMDDDLPLALAAADVTVARAGAATLGEFPALGLPAVLVPYPYAGAHQEMNARFLVERGAAVMIDDATLGSKLVPTLRRLLNSPEQIKAMSQSARALAVPDAANKIVDLLVSVEARR